MFQFLVLGVNGILLPTEQQSCHRQPNAKFSFGTSSCDVSRPFVQIPYQPDPNLRGYVGGFALGQHIFLTPHFNGVLFGKVGALSKTERMKGLARRVVCSLTSSLLLGATLPFYGAPTRVLCDDDSW